jgi:hypothetical protein
MGDNKIRVSILNDLTSSPEQLEYIEKVLHPLLAEMVLDALQSSPKSPASFLLSWLFDHLKVPRSISDPVLSWVKLPRPRSPVKTSSPTGEKGAKAPYSARETRRVSSDSKEKVPAETKFEAKFVAPKTADAETQTEQEADTSSDEEIHDPHEREDNEEQVGELNSIRHHGGLHVVLEPLMETRSEKRASITDARPSSSRRPAMGHCLPGHRGPRAPHW